MSENGRADEWADNPCMWPEDCCNPMWAEYADRRWVDIGPRPSETVLVVEWYLTANESGFFRRLSDGRKVPADDEEIRKLVFERPEVDKDGYYLYPPTYQYSHPMSVWHPPDGASSRSHWNWRGPRYWRPAMSAADYGDEVRCRFAGLCGFLRALYLLPGFSDRYSIRERHAINRHIHQIAEEMDGLGFGLRMRNCFVRNPDSGNPDPDDPDDPPPDVIRLADILPEVLEGIRARVRRAQPRRRAA